MTTSTAESILEKATNPSPSGAEQSRKTWLQKQPEDLVYHCREALQGLKVAAESGEPVEINQFEKVYGMFDAVLSKFERNVAGTRSSAS